MATGAWTPVAAAGLFSRAPKRAVRDLFVRTFGSIWFLLLAIFMAVGETTPSLSWPQFVSGGCLCVFYLMLWLLMVTRPPATSEATGLLPKVAAFVGTYMPWAITFFARNQEMVPNVLASVCVTGGTLLMILSLVHLGHAFSLVPQARHVVQSGPYRWIRHPLYLAEEIAIAGVALQTLSVVTVAIFVAHIGVQVCRIRYEEALLRQTIPGYDAYGKSARWRLIPGVW